MSSRIEQSFVALATLLGTIPGVTVERNRDIPVDLIAGATGFVVTDGSDQDGYPIAMQREYEFRVGALVQGYVARNTFAELGPALDALWGVTFVTLADNPRLLNGADTLTTNVEVGPTERELQTEQKKPTMAFRLPVTLWVHTNLSALVA